MEIKKVESKKDKPKVNICGGKLMGEVHPSDDNEMVYLGLRPPLIIRNPNLHVKTEAEREEIKKNSHLKVSGGSTHTRTKREVIKGRLTMYFENTKKDPNFKTTESVICFKHEVNGCLRERREEDKLTIKKYHFNY